jgi:monoamine oxidase
MNIHKSIVVVIMDTSANPDQIQPLNPTKNQRRTLAYNALVRNGHPEDFGYIVQALSPPPDITTIVPPGSCKGRTVGIIGGGLAGMAAAFELRKAGFDITVFEANEERIGGRVFTYYFDRERTLYGELGAMRLPVIHEAVWHYIDLFGLDTRPFIQVSPNAFIYLNGIRVRNDPDGANVRNEIYPTYGLKAWEYGYSWQQLGFMGIDAPVLSAPPETRQEILQVLPHYSSYTLYWDALDIRQAMERKGLSQGAISMLSNLFPIGGRFLYNNYIDFVQEYYPANFIYLYEISGGMAKLPEAFHKSFTSIDPGRYYSGIPADRLGIVRWEAGVTVTGIYRQEYGGQVTLAHMPTKLWSRIQDKNNWSMNNSGYGKISRFDRYSLPEISYNSSETDDRSNTKGVSFSNFDYVVCAVPFSVLRALDIRPLLSEPKMQAIREVTYSPAQKTLFNCRRRFWEEQGIYGGGSYTDLPINTIWYPSWGFGRQNGVLVASYGFNMDAVRLSNLPEDRRIENVMRDVEKVHGLKYGALDPIVSGSVTQFWDRDPFHRGTFCYFTPQQKKLFSWTMTQPEYGGRLVFAGEHVSAVHRWQQGAIKSGMDAANAIAAAARRA